MLIGSWARKSLCSIEKIQPRMMVAAFIGNPITTITSYYNPTDASDETDIDPFYNELSSLVLITGGGMNAQIGKSKNNKFNLHNPSNTNGEQITDFTLENGLRCLNTKSQKRKRKFWTYAYVKSAKAQINSTPINLCGIFLFFKVCLPITELSRQRYV